MRAGSCTATSSLRTCSLDEREHAYLADFGLSRYLGDAALPLGPAKSLGTADYVAPEQIRGEEVDGRADVYALGCMLYECLAGEPPFRRGTDAATLYAQLEEAPPALPGLEEVLPKALAKEPAERYATCGELIEAAREALGIAEPKRSRWPLAVAVVGVALIGAALLAFFLTSRRRRHASGARARTRSSASTRRRTRSPKRCPVGRLAGSVAADSRDVWVTSTGDGTVWRIDAKTGSVLKLAAHGTPTAVALGGGKAIVADAPEHRIVSLDAATGTVGFVTPLAGPGGFSPLPVAAGPGRRLVRRLAQRRKHRTRREDRRHPCERLPERSNRHLRRRDDPRLLATSSSTASLPGTVRSGWRASARERVVWRLDPEDAPGRRADPPAVHPEGDRGRRGCRLGDVAARRHRLADRPDGRTASSRRSRSAAARTRSRPATARSG